MATDGTLTGPGSSCGTVAGLVDSPRTVSHRRPGSLQRECAMAQAVGGMSKQTLAKALGAGSLAFGLLSVVAPRVVAGTYGVPVTPAGLQLQRLFGSRSAGVSGLALAAHTHGGGARGGAAGAAVKPRHPLAGPPAGGPGGRA